MFKEKTSKKRLNVTNNAKDNSTLDVMHNKMIKTFSLKHKEKQEYIELLDELCRSQKYIKAVIARHVDTNDDTYNDLWTSNIKLTEDIINIRNKLKDIDEFDEIEYYKKTSNILFSYYDMLEKQSKIKYVESISDNISLYTDYQSNPNKQTAQATQTSQTSQTSQSTQTAQATQTNNPVQTSQTTGPTTQALILSTPGGGTYKSILDALNNTGDKKMATHQVKPEDNKPRIEQPAPIIDKSTLVDEYLFITSKNHIKKINSDDLELCKCCKSQMVCLQHDAIIICKACGYQELLLVEQNRPILKQNIKDTSHFSYKRINHFREWCNQVQGKESTDIPDEIFEKILNEIKKEKILDTKTITYTKMREILKRLRINKYYEHINYIINRINGIPTPQFSSELEEKLCNMFRDIQGPFLKHCPKDRKNFLSYSYVLYKFFQILGLHEYLKYFPLLKSREKLYVQDQIWKKICEELNYEFIPSPSL
jgi:hypothetical protein